MVSKPGIVIIGLGMAPLPHARSLLALGDHIDVVHAFSHRQRGARLVPKLMERR